MCIIQGVGHWSQQTYGLGQRKFIVSFFKPMPIVVQRLTLQKLHHHEVAGLQVKSHVMDWADVLVLQGVYVAK